jgi:diguanylate cyclase (GGDEF)-like protein
MAEFENRLEFKKATLFMNISMLIVHTMFLVIFHLLHVKMMFYINIGSIVWYLLCFIIIKLSYYSVYVYLLLVEIWVHLIAATICLGWNAGFALYNFGLISIIFYTNYTFGENKKKTITPIIVTFISVFIFLYLRIHSDAHAVPLYIIDSQYIRIFYYVNAILVFFFTSFFLILYAKNVVRSESSLHEIADYDELTNLYNRHRMRDILSKTYEHTMDGTKNFCTTIIDIDDFKIVNDTYGHDAGDYVLKTVSAIMKKICKESETAYVGRWGGEEFLVVQEYEREKNSSIVPCINTIKKIHDSIRDYKFVYDNHHIVITVTAGISAHQENASISATIRTADERLYKGKLNGKDCVALA